MPRPRSLFRLGSATLTAIGIGHAVLVDLLSLGLRTRVVTLSPQEDVLATMERTAADYGPLGETTAYRMLAGFSLWLALSLAFVGVTYLLLAAQPAVRLRPFVVLGLAISIVFLMLSIACFIVPPVIAAAIATVAFAGSWLRNET